MTHRLPAIVVALVLAAGCSGGDAAPSPTDAPSTAASTTAAATTTTVATLSRETVLAVGRCIEAADISLPLMLNLGSFTELDEAKALCDEAKLQADADGAVELVAALADLNLTLARMGFDTVANGGIHDAALDQTLDELLDHEATITALLG